MRASRALIWTRRNPPEPVGPSGGEFFRTGRWGSDPVRFVWIGIIVALAVANARAWFLATSSGFVLPPMGTDLTTLRDAGARWLASQPFYLPYQLAVPYTPMDWPQPIMYPPPVAPFFALFSVLPGLLWWVIPLGVALAIVVHHRPRPLAWGVIALLIIWPATAITILYAGNATMWTVMLVALATIRPGWAPLILLKPTLGPFALWGIRHRSWWISLGVLTAFSLLFVGMLPDYIRAMQHLDSSPLYSLWNVPVMLVPIVAWLGSARTGGSPARSVTGPSRRAPSGPAWGSRSLGT